MQNIEHYKGCILDARSHELRDGSGWNAEVYIAQPHGGSVLETQFVLQETFPTSDAAIDAALQVGRHKVQVGFEPKVVVPDRPNG